MLLTEEQFFCKWNTYCICESEDKGVECKFARVEKECLAIVWAVHKFQQYLYEQEFVLETNHSPLVYLNKYKVTNPYALGC